MNISILLWMGCQSITGCSLANVGTHLDSRAETASRGEVTSQKVATHCQQLDSNLRHYDRKPQTLTTGPHVPALWLTTNWNIGQVNMVTVWPMGKQTFSMSQFARTLPTIVSTCKSSISNQKVTFKKHSRRNAKQDLSLQNLIMYIYIQCKGKSI